MYFMSFAEKTYLQQNPSVRSDKLWIVADISAPPVLHSLVLRYRTLWRNKSGDRHADNETMTQYYSDKAFLVAWVSRFHWAYQCNSELGAKWTACAELYRCFVVLFLLGEWMCDVVHIFGVFVHDSGSFLARGIPAFLHSTGMIALNWMVLRLQCRREF